MPTVLLVDVSLSMSRPVEGQDDLQLRQLALHGVNTFLDYLTANNKLEYVSLVIFSSSWEHLVPWTRDYSLIRTALTDQEEHNKTCFETTLTGVGSLCMEEWGCNTPCQLVMFTDGNVGVGEGSLPTTLHNFSQSRKSPIPYPFPCKIHVMTMMDSAGIQSARGHYERLIEMNNGNGQVWCPESPLTPASIGDMLTRLSKEHFLPLSAVLKCGNLQCPVQIVPAPAKYDKDDDFEVVDKQVEKTMEICGFLNIADLGSPPYISRHLVLPVETLEEPGSPDTSGEGPAVEGKPAFTVLLHGSLKVATTVALVKLAEDWFGIIYSWADKKKSNLMMSIYKPGSLSLPWLGGLNYLGPHTDFSSPPYGDNDDITPFPVRPVKRRSYTQNCVVWIKNTGLQADIQKIIRNARKIPEKQVNFYKELNRLRQAAVSLGFYELLEAVAQLLERECQLLPGNSHPDAALQLTHAANALRSDYGHRDIPQPITPLQTNFAAGD